MSTSYTDTESGVNPQSRLQPGFFAVIPASVRYCNALPPAAKLLFGEITALCSVEGYCWAQNPYFMALYGVDRSTVKRWLAALAEQGFIRVEVAPDRRQRRIYLTPKSVAGVDKVGLNPPSEEVAQKRATSGAETRYQWGESEPQSITENNTKSKTLLNVADTPPSAAATEQKVSASPMSKKAASPVTPMKVRRLLEITQDFKSKDRFLQLYDIAVGANAEQVWDDAVKALETALGGSVSVSAHPGAYFQGILTNKLNDRGVRVPVGSRAERRSVQRVIRRSLAAADGGGGPL